MSKKQRVAGAVLAALANAAMFVLVGELFAVDVAADRNAVFAAAQTAHGSLVSIQPAAVERLA